MNRILCCFSFVFLSLLGMAQPTTRLLDVAKQKDKVYYYSGRNGATSQAIDQMFEWLLEEDDNIRNLRFKVLYYQAVSLDQVGDGLFSLRVNMSDIHLEDLPTFNGFDFSEEFMPKGLALNLEVYSGRKRLRSKRFEIPIENNQLKDMIQWNFKTESEDVSVQVTDYDFLFTNSSLMAVSKKLESIDSYIYSFIELDEIGMNLNKFNPDKVNPKTVDREIRKIEQLEKRFATINDRSFWKKLDYKAAEEKTGFDIEEMREEIGGYLQYLGQRYRGLKGNSSSLYADQAIDLFQKGKFDKAQEEVDIALKQDENNPEALLVQSLLKFKANEIDESGRTLLKAVKNPAIKKETLELGIEHGIVLRDHYIGETEKNLGLNNRSQAVDSFKKAKAWCTIFPEMDCPDVLFERLRVQLVD